MLFWKGLKENIKVMSEPWWRHLHCMQLLAVRETYLLQQFAVCACMGEFVSLAEFVQTIIVHHREYMCHLKVSFGRSRVKVMLAQQVVPGQPSSIFLSLLKKFT